MWPHEDNMDACPTCGRDDFKSEQGVKAHHARTHGESLVKSTRECAWCGDNVEVYDSRRGKNERVFCSDSDCHGKWQSENRSGKDSYIYEGGKQAVECVVCGDEKEVYPYRVEHHSIFFCSTECQSEYQSSQTGPDATRWKGGYVNYGKGWNDKKKEAVRERDNYVCQHPGCTVSNAEHKEQIGKSLEVHHIQPARSFDNPEDRNDMENLVTLCITHHQMWEEIAPLRPM